MSRRPCAGSGAATSPAGREPEAAAAADLLWRAVGELDFPGRMLSAANAALPVPEDGLARLWQAATVLREHRGDGHVRRAHGGGHRRVRGRGAARTRRWRTPLTGPRPGPGPGSVPR